MKTLILKSFEVYGLNNEENYIITFKNNKKIIVAENGSRKTTLLNILNSILDGNHEKLLKYTFEKVVLKFEDFPIYTIERINIEKRLTIIIKK